MMNPLDPALFSLCPSVYRNALEYFAGADTDTPSLKLEIDLLALTANSLMTLPDSKLRKLMSVTEDYKPLGQGTLRDMLIEIAAVLMVHDLLKYKGIKSRLCAIEARPRKSINPPLRQAALTQNVPAFVADTDIDANCDGCIL